MLTYPSCYHASLRRTKKKLGILVIPSKNISPSNLFNLSINIPYILSPRDGWRVNQYYSFILLFYTHDLIFLQDVRILKKKKWCENSGCWPHVRRFWTLRQNNKRHRKLFSFNVLLHTDSSCFRNCPVYDWDRWGMGVPSKINVDSLPWFQMINLEIVNHNVWEVAREMSYLTLRPLIKICCK